MKIWTSDHADERFSKFILARDLLCFFGCGKKPTDNSHYWNRGNSATRYDPDNCDGACRECHTLYGEDKKGLYKTLKIRQLGLRAFEALERKARGTMKRDSAILQCMALLGA